MGLTIQNTDTSEDLLIKPYRVLRSTKYMVKPILYPIVVSIGKQSIRVEIFFKIPETWDGAITFLKRLSDSVEVVNSDHEEVPKGMYYVESVEMKHETSSIGVIDCRISMFKYE